MNEIEVGKTKRSQASALERVTEKPPRAEKIESLARDVFLRFLDLPGYAGVKTEHLAQKAIDYAEAFYLTLDHLRTEK